jgi:hypothetical protein
MPCFRGIFLFVLLSLPTVSLAARGAAPKVNPDPGPNLSRRIPDNPFKCDRQIRYGGRTMPCDSSLHRDGEALRPIMENTPSALERLDQYQANRRKLNFAAYTGTAGLVIALAAQVIGGALIAQDPVDGDRSLRRGRKLIRYGGLAITAGSIAFGISSLRSNEQYLQGAVNQYNEAHPEKQLELLFKTEF